MNLRPPSNWIGPPSQGSRLARGSDAATEWTARWLRRAPIGPAATDRSGVDALHRTPRLARAEAALFVADRPLSARKLAQHAALIDAEDAGRAVSELNSAFDADGSPFRVEQLATGYQLLTRPDFAPWLEKVHSRQTRLRLSSAAMETLAIVAYRQPLTRADVEAVRGVQSSEMLKVLMERDLVRIVGEDDSLGRPYLYGTTRQFLELYGLHSLGDLPDAEALAPPAPVAEEGKLEPELDEDADAADDTDEDLEAEAVAA